MSNSMIEKEAKKEFDKLWDSLPFINKLFMIKDTCFTIFLYAYSKGAMRGVELMEEEIRE